jgi:hypothetical protein
VIERAIMPEELTGFEQCFLTGTAAEVTPVSEIGPYRFEVGEIAKTLMNDYSAEVQPKHAPSRRSSPACTADGGRHASVRRWKSSLRHLTFIENRRLITRPAPTVGYGGINHHGLELHSSSWCR